MVKGVAIMRPRARAAGFGPSRSSSVGCMVPEKCLQTLLVKFLVDLARLLKMLCAADMKVFRYDPADHPDLPQDLKDWLSCVKNALALKTQLNILLIHREDMKKRLARLGKLGKPPVRALYSL